jgi:hypothetical protein
MDWWLWILLGLALLGAEMLTPGGFYVLFFGAAALVVGALVAAGAGGSVAVQWLLFSLGSIVSLVVFRQRLLALFRSPASGQEVDSLAREVAVLTEDLPANGHGKAELRGTTWSVRNAEGRDLCRGQRCRVERVEGLTLWVRAQ